MTRAVEASFPVETNVSRSVVLWLELPKRFDSRALFDEALEHGICFAHGASQRVGDTAIACALAPDTRGASGWQTVSDAWVTLHEYCLVADRP
jgi:DNA-binding transcriptional MocR family regulator